MKKLMIAAAMVCAAAFAQAAAVDWSAGGVVDAWATATAGKSVAANGWAGYMILNSAYETVSADLAKGDTKSLLAASLVDTKYTTSKGAFSLTKAQGNVAAGDQTFWMIVVNNADISKATYFYSASMEKAVDSSLDTNVAFGSQATNSKVVGNWTAMAPEPTSGLLLLIGMGALALRRRRA